MKVNEGKRKSQASSLQALSLGHGKRVRLWRLLYAHGPANGTLLVLPLDQGLEHGPSDFLPNPAALDTDFQFRLALEGRYSAIALGVGLAERYFGEYAGRVPLILKLNGKTNIPDDAAATSPLFASVEDAVRLGADAVGVTLYVGTPRQDEEIRQVGRVRADCERYGMPLVVWSYPRGSAIEARGGKGTLYAIDYAARLAEEIGADIVKLHEPKECNERCPEAYRKLREDLPARLRRVVRSAGRCRVIFSGGLKEDDATLLKKARLYMESGATGLVFGRNMWQRSYRDALALTGRVHRLLTDFGR
jgi:class I fructose-bisphosphate aldolase